MHSTAFQISITHSTTYKNEPLAFAQLIIFKMISEKHFVILVLSSFTCCAQQFSVHSLGQALSFQSHCLRIDLGDGLGIFDHKDWERCLIKFVLVNQRIVTIRFVKFRTFSCNPLAVLDLTKRTVHSVSQFMSRH